MRSFSDPAFFRVLDTLLAPATATARLRTNWTIDKTHVERSRHSCTADDYSFTVEVCRLSQSGVRGWRLIIVKEYWHLGAGEGLPRQVRWAKLLSGRRPDALAWFKAREADIEQRWPQAQDRNRPRRSSGSS